jgi:hypothetical protein
MGAKPSRARSSPRRAIGDQTANGPLHAVTTQRHARHFARANAPREQVWESQATPLELSERPSGHDHVRVDSDGRRALGSQRQQRNRPNLAAFAAKLDWHDPRKRRARNGSKNLRNTVPYGERVTVIVIQCAAVPPLDLRPFGARLLRNRRR